MFKTIASFAVVVAVLAAVTVGLTYGGLWVSSWSKPAAVAIDNKTFHESAQLNDGMSRDIDNIRQEYLASTTTEGAKAALRATVIHRFGNYDITRLAADQQAFIRQIRGY